jgi:hypothetical protein
MMVLNKDKAEGGRETTRTTVDVYKKAMAVILSKNLSIMRTPV